MNPQMQQILSSHNLAYQQQQLERLRRRQASAPRPVADIDKDRPLVQVKIENQTDLPIDSNTFNAINARHPQMQFRQQQLAALSSFHSQSNNQFRQMGSPQIPSMQSHSP